MSPDNPKRLDRAWRSFSERVIPAGAPTVQRMEMRRAFYAGAQAWFGIIFCLDPGEEATDRDMAKIGYIEEELAAFCADVLAGRA